MGQNWNIDWKKIGDSSNTLLIFGFCQWKWECAYGKKMKFKGQKRSIFPWDALKLSVWSMLLKMAPLVYCLLRKLIRKGSIRTRRKLTQNTAFFCLWNSTLRPFKLTQKKNESWEKILDIVLQENVILHSLSEANDPWNSHFHIFSLTSLFLSTLL